MTIIVNNVTKYVILLTIIVTKCFVHKINIFIKVYEICSYKVNKI
jgi:hypothetical protein